MKWLLVFTLMTGEVAELPTTKAGCYEALDAARKTGWMRVRVASRKDETVPAWNVVCVEIGDATRFANK